MKFNFTILLLLGLIQITFAQNLIGKIKLKELQKEPYASWYQSGYNDYQPNKEMVKTLEPLFENVKMKVFFGTWCGDSQRDVPKLGKIFHELGLKKQITWYGVDRDKKTQKGDEVGQRITNVPTVIFYDKQGKEINRIVEMPIDTLEKDMLEILTTNNYKDTYHQ